MVLRIGNQRSAIAQLQKLVYFLPNQMCSCAALAVGPRTEATVSYRSPM
jgi:hypothetical protein